MTSWAYPFSKEDDVSRVETRTEDTPRWPSRRFNGVGAALTVGIHIAVISLLLAARTNVEIPPAPIHVAVISDTQETSAPLESLVKPHLNQPTLHIPQPEITIADDSVMHALPIAVATTASSSMETAALAQTPPAFDANYLNNPAPSYPPLARRMREEGVVLVRVFVSPEGWPDQIELKRSSGSARLDEAALAVIKKWRFVPARRGVEPVAAWVVVPIAFNLTA